MTIARFDRRPFDALRVVRLRPNAVVHPAGSCLVEFGRTRVLCTASVDEKSPQWLAGQNRGWVTAEYAMLPGATHTRGRRETAGGKPNARGLEIQRLIGRALRASVNLSALAGMQIVVDCDVLQADGGTRTAAVTGGFVALALAVARLERTGRIAPGVAIVDPVAAVSVGIVDGTLCLDLDYAEDSRADTDANVVMTASGGLVEVQATAERKPFSPAELSAMIALAADGVRTLSALQAAAVEEGIGAARSGEP